MEVIHISAECYPAAKVLGLGDVVGALPKYQQELGHKASVIVPLYSNQFKEAKSYQAIFKGTIVMDKLRFPFTINKETTGNQGFDLFFVAIPGLFDRSEMDGYKDDSERFLAFQIAVLDWLLSMEKLPKVVHCHDYQAGIIPFLMTQAYKYEQLKNIPTVLTIHNALNQGQFGFNKINYIPEFNLDEIDLLIWDNCINSLATGIKCAWNVTAVSPSYLEEKQHFPNGIASLLQLVKAKSTEILNGIDSNNWNPKNDKLTSNYNNHFSAVLGKSKNKKALCK